jgi:hypothetical protein
MPKPTTKAHLLAESQKEHEALEQFIAALTPEEILQGDRIGVWSVKDTLAHLTAWEQMMLGWYSTGLHGETPALPAPGYKWNQLAALNQAIYEQHRDQPLAEVLDAFHTSYREATVLVESVSEDELFTPGFFAWTRPKALASFVIPNMVEHYRWARTTLRKGFRRGGSVCADFVCALHLATVSTPIG